MGTPVATDLSVIGLRVVRYEIELADHLGPFGTPHDVECRICRALFTQLREARALAAIGETR